jgi:hypothetical protein
MSQAGAVTMKAMVQRLNRRLERDSKVLRSPRGDVDRSRFGNYFIVDTIRNVVVHAKLSPRQLEETARAREAAVRIREGDLRRGSNSFGEEPFLRTEAAVHVSDIDPNVCRGPAAAAFGTEMPQRSCSLLLWQPTKIVELNHRLLVHGHEVRGLRRKRDEASRCDPPCRGLPTKHTTMRIRPRRPRKYCTVPGLTPKHRATANEME